MAQSKDTSATCLSLSATLDQSRFVEELEASISATFSDSRVLALADCRDSIAKLQEMIDANKHDPASTSAETEEHALEQAQRLSQLAQLMKAESSFQKAAERSFANAKETIGFSAMAILRQFYPGELNTATAQSSAAGLILILRQYWRDTWSEGCAWSLRQKQLCTPLCAPGATVTLAQKLAIANNRLVDDDQDLAADIVLYQLDQKGLDAMSIVEARCKWNPVAGMSGDVAKWDYLNSLTPREFFSLLDEELSYTSRSRHGDSSTALGAASKGLRAPPTAPCSLHPGAAHDNATCKAQQALKASGKSQRASPSGAKLVCFNCQEPGHHFRQCPSKSAKAAPKTAAAPKTRPAGTAMAAVPKILHLTPQEQAKFMAFMSQAQTAPRTSPSPSADEEASGDEPDDGNSGPARAFFATATTKSPLFGLDTLANRHLFHDVSLFVQSSLRRLHAPIIVEGVCGDVELTVRGDVQFGGFLLSNVFHCPSSPVNVVSLGKLTDQFPRWQITWDRDRIRLSDQHGLHMFTAVKTNGLFLATILPSCCAPAPGRLPARLADPPRTIASAANVPLIVPASSSQALFMYYHRLWGHPSLKRMRWMAKIYTTPGLGAFPISVCCDICNEAKSKRGPIPTSTRASRESHMRRVGSFSDRFSVDIKESTTEGFGGIKWITAIFSEKTSFMWPLLTRTNDEISGKLCDFYAMYKVHFEPTNGPIAFFRADNDKALFPAAAASFWAQYGAVTSFSAPYTPGHNNRAESAIRTMTMTSRALLRDSPLEDLYWPFAVTYACHLLVRRPTSAAPHTTPAARMLLRPPTMPTTSFGTIGHWTPPDQHPAAAERHTFSPRGFSCFFLGFDSNSETTNIIMRHDKIYSTVDVTFPRPGALLITRDDRNGTHNFGHAADTTYRADLFASSPAPPTTLAGRPYFLGEHLLDCTLCDKHRARRLLLMCEFCANVAHIRCAGLRAAPGGPWICASCSVQPQRPLSSIDITSPVPLVPVPVPRIPLAPPAPPVPVPVIPVIAVPSRRAIQPPQAPLLPLLPAPARAPPCVTAPPTVPLPQPPLHQHSFDCTRPPFHDGPCGKVTFSAPEPPVPSTDLSDVDEPLPGDGRSGRLQRRTLLQAVGEPSALRLGANFSDTLVAAAMSSIAGTRHLAPLALRDAPQPAVRFPVALDEPFLDDLPVRPSTRGLRDLPLLLEKPGGINPRFAKLHRLLAAGAVPIEPLPQRTSSNAFKVNPYSYVLYANATAGKDDAKSRAYSLFAGYNAANPRLGERFQYDTKRISRQGLTLPEAMRSPHATEYAAADLRERDILLSTGSLKPVPRNQAKGYKISFRHLCSFKPHKIGAKQFDSRLCLHGFRQPQHSYDPNRVSTPVARVESVKLTMAWAVGRKDCDNALGDADRAFLQAPLTDNDADMWIDPPPSWESPVGTVLQVVNSIYGLKQSCYNWCEKLDGVLAEGGAIPFQQDPRSFILARYSDGKLLRTFIHAHVDDMKIIGNEVPFVKAMIAKHIQVTWKGGNRPKIFCGMEYEYSSSGAILLHMQETVLSLVALCEACGINLDGVPTPSSPMLPGVSYELLRSYATDGLVPANDKFYRSACGLCIWLECGVRPDISFALGVLTSALGKNTRAHDAALLRLIAWLRGTATHGLVYGGDPSEKDIGFMGWMDSSFADRLAARSTQGFIIKFNGCLLKWCSRKQPCIALDTMEAEYISASTYCRALLGLLNLLADMYLEQGPVISFEDNTAAYGLIKHALITRGARHINVRFNSVQEVEHLRITEFRHCTTDKQQADLTTKALDPSKLSRNLAALLFVSIAQFHASYG